MGRQRTPAPPPPPQQSSDSQGLATEAAIAQAIALILAGAITITTTPLLAVAALLKLIPSIGEMEDGGGSVSTVAAHLVVEDRKPVAEAPGVRRASQTANLSYSAHYAIEAAKRLAGSVAEGDDLRKALRKESRYLAQHRDANRRREAGARMVEAAMDLHGPFLGWTHGNPKEPRLAHLRADGMNFDARTIPASTGALPGVLPGCTCTPRAPFPNAPTLT